MDSESCHSSAFESSAIYALARRNVRRADWGQGMLFGLMFWLAFDEIITVATGVARPPKKYPWQAHARGLVGHVAYGVVANTAMAAALRLSYGKSQISWRCSRPPNPKKRREGVQNVRSSRETYD